MIEVKICDNCGHHNAVDAMECSECGYDLTFAFPQKIEEASPAEAPSNENSVISRETMIMQGPWRLVYEGGEREELTIDGEISLGRDCGPFNRQFNSSNYTSRTHAKIRVNEGAVQVMDASTNGTFVDEVRIPKMEWTDVPADSTVKFADVSFVLKRG